MEKVAAFVALANSVVIAKGMLGFRSLRKLSELDAAKTPLSEWPRVSIVIPARNEEAKIESALSSVLSIDYPDLEILVVNDRSTDATPKILDRMVATHSKLHCVTVAELPPGWLGKNHALYQGFLKASGKYLLFTDADVHFDPSTIKKAVAAVERSSLDHLALFMGLDRTPTILKFFVAYFGLGFFSFFQPWKARDPKKKNFVGIGAFNLVRKRVLQETNALEKIRLCPDDDVRMGKVVKEAGFSQELMIGCDLISVEWYSSLRECMVGLEKNQFAGLDFRVSLVIVSLLAIAIFQILPLYWIFQGELYLSLLGWISYIAIVLSVRQGTAPLRFSWLPAILWPLGGMIFVSILVRTTFLNLWEGGLRWRGTFYSLEELRRNRA